MNKEICNTDWNATPALMPKTFEFGSLNSSYNQPESLMSEVWWTTCWNSGSTNNIFKDQRSTKWTFNTNQYYIDNTTICFTYVFLYKYDVKRLHCAIFSSVGDPAVVGLQCVETITDPAIFPFWKCFSDLALAFLAVVSVEELNHCPRCFEAMHWHPGPATSAKYALQRYGLDDLMRFPQCLRLLAFNRSMLV